MKTEQTKPKRYRASKGSIIDLDSLCAVAYVQAIDCSAKLRDRIAKLAVDRLNSELNGEWLAKQYDRNNKVKP